MEFSRPSSQVLLSVTPLGFPWRTLDPFLFCAHHDDAYPQGNDQMGPAASLTGRDLGQDFGRKDGWSMYHGETVPGFPAHPHRGFETVTIVRKGLIDHSDSLGATARFGAGDVQWLTAGAGIVHAEMFPLLERSQANPVELFQIWLNLPAKNKMVAPYFTMTWAHQIPRQVVTDAQGFETTIDLIAGSLGQANGQPAVPQLPPPPDSWAAQANSDVAICTLKLAPGARWTVPAARNPAAQRMLYFFSGTGLQVAGVRVEGASALELRADAAAEMINLSGSEPAELLLLQGLPIGEPVEQYGPFVMNTRAEIAQAMSDYRRTQFGGWPWPVSDPVHGPAPRRFARLPNGQTLSPDTATG